VKKFVLTEFNWDSIRQIYVEAMSEKMAKKMVSKRYPTFEINNTEEITEKIQELEC
jgi:hypothetical protein